MEEHLIHVHLERLQHDIRVNRVLGVLVLIAIVGILLAWYQSTRQEIADVILARKIVITHAEGRSMADLISTAMKG